MNNLLILFIILSLKGLCALEVHDDGAHRLLLMNLNQAGSIVLDCDYEFTNDEEKAQVEVKWYFNDEPTPFYMWVPSGGRKPQLVGSLFEGHIDLDYSANEDEFKAHSSVRIVNPNTKFSGTYVCKVATFESEEFQERTLIIYAPPDEIKFLAIEDGVSDDGEPEPTNVTCIIEGVYPEPQVQLSWKLSSDENDEIEGSGILTDAVIQTSYDDDKGLFDVIATYTIDENILFTDETLQESVELGCELVLSEIEYQKIEHLTYTKRQPIVTDETEEPGGESSGFGEELGSGSGEEQSGSGSGCEGLFECTFSGSGSGSGSGESGSGESGESESNEYEIVDEDLNSEEGPNLALGGSEEGNGISSCAKLRLNIAVYFVLAISVLMSLHTEIS